MTQVTGNVVAVLMPQAGNTMEEGTIIKWNVKVGDRVKVGDILFEVETDKAAVEVEATDAGRVARIVVDEGQTIEVLKPVAYLAENDADVDAFLRSEPAAQGPTPKPTELKDAPAPTAKTAATSGERAKASPAARKLAGERGVDLSSLGAGSGPGGRIVSADVPAGGASQAAATGEPVRRKMSAMRKAIARNLLASKQNIPHFYIELTVNAGPMMDFYRAAKAQYPCTVNDVVVLACSRAIEEFPSFRSRVDGEELVEFPTANIGVAVGMDAGLVVPVVVAAERMSLRQIGAEIRRLAEAARAGKIEGRGKGVFTISNLGMFGVARFSAIINPPEAAILAVGAVREEVIVQDGVIRPGRVLTLTLSCDHRVIDGLEAAKFLARLKVLLEKPEEMKP